MESNYDQSFIVGCYFLFLVLSPAHAKPTLIVSPITPAPNVPMLTTEPISPLGEIATCNDLQNIQNYLAGNYVLINDIDCSGIIFSPIGSSAYSPFTGNLDGQGYSIKNLTVQTSQITQVPAGLFGYVNGGTISNLHIVAAKVIPPVSTSSFPSSGNDNAGILAGDIMFGASVNNVTVQGTVTTGNTVGGLVGTNWDGTIFRSSADVVVQGPVAGGLVGYNAG